MDRNETMISEAEEEEEAGSTTMEIGTTIGMIEMIGMIGVTFTIEVKPEFNQLPFNKRFYRKVIFVGLNFQCIFGVLNSR